MKRHFSHYEHPLVLNEDYIAKEGDVCRGCREEISSCKNLVFSCSRTITHTSDHVDPDCAHFLLHKSCLYLPIKLLHPNCLPYLLYPHLSAEEYEDSKNPLQCGICGCGIRGSGFVYIAFSTPMYFVCIRCVMSIIEERIYKQPAAHPQHTLKVEHFSHVHSLMLNEVYIAKEGDVCRGCNEACKSFVYSCSLCDSSTSTFYNNHTDYYECAGFLLHKSCAELPSTMKHPDDHDVSLYLYSSRNDVDGPLQDCSICGCWYSWSHDFIYTSSDKTLSVCARCAMSSFQDVYINQHPAHPQHALKFVHHLSSFQCYACNVVDDNIKDFSYICTKCRFWIHKSCADAPHTFQFQFHDKHPLKLSFSLPQAYQNFPQYCRLCNKKLRGREWLYYCLNCRFFVHFHCARSNPTKRLNEDELYDSDAVHLPAADESSADQLAEEFVMAMSTLSTPNCFRHWDHGDHDLQLMTINDLNDKKDDDEILILCNGCVKPIRTDHHDNHFYGCVSCNYFMHKACAGLSREIEHHLQPAGITLYAYKYPNPIFNLFECNGCGVITNGIAFDDTYKNSFHIGCLALPKKIKHEAHNHQLNQVFTDEHTCKACGLRITNSYKHCCEKCDFYVCSRCIMKPRRVEHRWDPHPLSLIYDASMVSDHEHEFNCEFCSEEIDTNFWFYHCSDCDLSFHFQNSFDRNCLENCFERSRCRQYSNVKFGAAIYVREIHHHTLTFVLHKKVGSCKKCHELPPLGSGVLECAPCKVIFCMRCLTAHFLRVR